MRTGNRTRAARAPSCARLHQSGFTYMGVLFMVAFMGLGLGLTGDVWRTTVQREKEAQLLFVGNQYRQAIQQYYQSGPTPQYPRTLQDMLKDSRKLRTERYLRKLYIDPVSGKDEWGLVKGPDGGIMGVYSLSQDKPLKLSGFRIEDKDFQDSEKYSDWKFVAGAGQAAQIPQAETGSSAPPAAGGSG